MPVIFSVLSILPALGILRELGNRRAAIITGMMLALGFCHINMAQENRPYSLSGLLVNLSFYLLVRMEQRWGRWTPRQRWIHATLHGTVLFAAMMNHYFAGFAFVGQAVYVLIRWRGPMLRAWLISTGFAAAMFCVVWGPHLWGQRDFIASQEWLLEKEADHAQRTVLRVADLPIRFLFRVSRFKLDAGYAVLGAAILAGIGLVLWKGGRSRSLLFGCWYVVPVALFAVIDLATQRQHLTHFRYSSVALPALCALFAMALTSLPRVIETAAAFAFVLACVPTMLTLPAQDNPHTRSAVRLMEADLGPDDLVIFDAVDWPSFWALRMYQMISYYLPKPNPPMLLLRESPDPALVEQIQSFEHLYVVSPRPEVVPNPTPETHPFVEHSVYFKEIGWVYRCSRRAPN